MPHYEDNENPILLLYVALSNSIFALSFLYSVRSVRKSVPWIPKWDIYDCEQNHPNDKC